MAITPLQHKIYGFLRDYLAGHGYAPSLAEIARGIGVSPKSVSLISRSIHALAEAGMITLDQKGYRNIRLTDAPGFSLPLLGRIAAGVPIAAIEDKQMMDLSVLVQGDNRFILEVKGDSMIDKGILDGDLAICRYTNHADEGDIVVALIDQQDATLKTLSYQVPGRITLMPANSLLKPKAYLPQHVQIQGVYVGLVRLAV
jgi:repressor LexA